MTQYKVGEIRVPNPNDFADFKNFVLSSDGWKEKYNKKELSVSTRDAENSTLKMFKVITTFTDLSAEELYDTIHDPEYRFEWDIAMSNGYEICRVSDNSDVGYYAFKAPKPIKDRDYVTQRCWNTDGREFIVFNHSVFHKKCPAQSDKIRAISFLTGYYIQKLGPSTTKIYYVSHNDPRGKIPHMIINWGTTTLIPKVLKKLHAAAKGYNKWKAQHKPEFKPWLFPEQQKDLHVPDLDPADIMSQPDYAAEMIDETKVVLDKEYEEASASATNGNGNGDC